MTIVLDYARPRGRRALPALKQAAVNMYGKPAARTPRAGLADGDPAGAGESQVVPDLFQEGRIGLWRAILHYEVGRGAKYFSVMPVW